MLFRRIQRKAETLAACAAPEPALAKNLERLADLAGLDTDVERRLLLFAIYLHSEWAIEEASDLLGSLSFERTAHVLSHVIAADEAAVRFALRRNGPLASVGLLTLDAGIGVCLKSKLDLLYPGFATVMRSETTDDPVSILNGRVMRARAAELPLESFSNVPVVAGRLLPYLRSVVNSTRRGANVFLWGATGAGKSSAIRTVAATLGLDCYEVADVDPHGAPIPGPVRVRAYLAAQRLLRNRPNTLLVFEEWTEMLEWSPFCDEQTQRVNKAFLVRALEQNEVPTVWISNDIDFDPAYARRADLCICMETVTEHRRAIVDSILGNSATAETRQALAEMPGVTPGILARAHEVSGLLATEVPTDSRDATLRSLVAETLRVQTDGSRITIAPLVAREATYRLDYINADVDVVALLERLKERRRRGKLSCRLLTIGIPGSGKSAFAIECGRQLGMKVEHHSGSTLLGRFVGESEAKARRALQPGEGKIIVLDEADTFFDRTRADQNWEISLQNELLQLIERFDSVLIASTNRHVSDAFLRRMDAVITFSALRPTQAVALLQHHCRELELPPPDAVSRERVARLTPLCVGDFAQVSRRSEFAPVPDATRLVDLLAKACSLKSESGGKAPMGFV